MESVERRKKKNPTFHEFLPRIKLEHAGLNFTAEFGIIKETNEQKRRRKKTYKGTQAAWDLRSDPKHYKAFLYSVSPDELP